VRAAWGDEPYNQYGATETADIAAEYQGCRHMHVFEDLVIVEPVDEQHRPVPPGEFGAKLLVTVLFSRTQPLIRYELNDSVRLAVEAGDCGLPFAVLEGIQGRVEDALSLPSSAGGRVTIQPLLFNRVMDVLPLSGWQVIQGPDEGLTVLLGGVHGTLTDEIVEAQLSAALAEQGARIPHLTVQRVPEIPKTPSGKTPQIKAHRPRVR
jgi:phenylacetate-coenzyme A ligase PaaK-like adenylate-forming protein